MLLVIAGGFFLSTAGIAVRSLQQADGLQIVFYRSLGMALFMLLFLLYRDSTSLLRSIRQPSWLEIGAGAFFAGASLSIIYAMLHTTVANAMFIVSLAPLFGAFGGWVFLRERVPTRTWIAVGLAITGVLVMVQGGLSARGWLGIAWAFAMAVCYGLFTVCVRAGRNGNMLPAIAWSGVMLALVAALAEDSLSIPLGDAAICLAMGAFQVGMGGLLLTLGAAHVPAAQISLLAMLEVVLSPVWVWLGVGETPTAASLIGGTIILLAVAFQALTGSEPEPANTGFSTTQR